MNVGMCSYIRKVHAQILYDANWEANNDLVLIAVEFHVEVAVLSEPDEHYPVLNTRHNDDRQFVSLLRRNIFPCEMAEVRMAQTLEHIITQHKTSKADNDSVAVLNTDWIAHCLRCN